LDAAEYGARDRLSEWWWHGVRNLKRLLGSGAAEDVIARETLDYGGFADGDRAVMLGVDGHRAVTRDQRPCLVSLETAVRNRAGSRLDLSDLLYNRGAVRHR